LRMIVVFLSSFMATSPRWHLRRYLGRQGVTQFRRSRRNFT